MQNVAFSSNGSFNLKPLCVNLNQRPPGKQREKVANIFQPPGEGLSSHQKVSPGPSLVTMVTPPSGQLQVPLPNFCFQPCSKRSLTFTFQDLGAVG